MANLNDTITDGSAKFKVVKSATNTDLDKCAKLDQKNVFSDEQTISKSDENAGKRYFLCQAADLEKGTPPDTTKYYTMINLYDKNSVLTNFDRLGFIEYTVDSTKAQLILNLPKFEKNTDNRAVMGLRYSHADTAGYAFCPTLTDLRSNTDTIVTTKWCRKKGLEDSAASHNALYRGYDLTDYFNSGEMSTDIANNDWSNIYIGDYIIKTINLPAITYTDKAGNEQTQAAQTFTNVKWYVAGLDLYLHGGSNQTTDHHVVLIPNRALQKSVAMNPTADTTGGYISSDMWTIHMVNWANAIKTAFGNSHVLTHQELLSNAINDTVPSGAGGGFVGSAYSWVWVDVDVNIPNEQMIYGGRVWGSGFDSGSFPGIFPLFAHKGNHLDDRTWFWLRTVASKSNFANVVNGGISSSGATLSSGDGGIRPYFLLT